MKPLIALLDQILFVSIMCLTLLISFSCEKEGSAAEKESPVKLRATNPYAYIGDYHNDGLDSVYNYLKAIKDDGGFDTISNHPEFKALLIQGVKEFSADIGISDDFPEGDSIAELQIDDIFSANFENTKLEELLSEDSFSAGFQDVVNGLVKVSNDTTYTIEERGDERNKYLDSLGNITDSVEVGVLQGMIAIAESSLEYWTDDDNLNKWTIGLFGDGDRPRLRYASPVAWLYYKVSGKTVVKNDIGYGAAGGATGAIVGGTVTFGAATVPGWVGGAILGGVGGSVGSFAVQVLDAIWP